MRHQNFHQSAFQAYARPDYATTFPSLRTHTSYCAPSSTASVGLLRTATAPPFLCRHDDPFAFSLPLSSNPLRTPALYSHGNAYAFTGAVLQSTAKSSALTPMAVVYMVLLALQFGVQPRLSRKYTPRAANRRVVVFIQEWIKLSLAGAMLLSGGMAGVREAVAGWNWKVSIAVAGTPAALYAVQNVFALMGYQNLDSVAFNVLNQTKTLSAALCCYLIMGRKQSVVQIFALFLLLCSGLVIEGTVKIDAIINNLFGKSKSTGEVEENRAVEEAGAVDIAAVEKKTRLITGVIPVLVASFISGLAGALAQRCLQGANAAGGIGRSSQLFTMELSFFSAMVLAASTVRSEADRKELRERGPFHDWNPMVFIPITVNAAGGVLVGLVTKYAGSVRKGFSLIAGLFLTGVIQAILERKNLTKEQYVGSIMAMLSMYLHITHPYIGS